MRSDGRRRVLVTGGLGFIGSGFVEKVHDRGHDVSVVDVGTYAADERRIAHLHPRVDVAAVDVADPGIVDVMHRFKPDLVVHFAAATHVTRSETDQDTFFRTNVEGTRTMLEAATSAGARTFVHVSTDEVYGPCLGEPFREDQKQAGEGLASSAYARSKALADDLATSWTDLPVVTARLTNCYGEWQHPEKAVPRWTVRAIEGKRLPVWGDGGQVRQWMHRSDACDALWLLCERGEPGTVYNVAPPTSEVTNLEVARAIATAAGQDPSLAYLTAYDRPDHDRRYAIDASRMATLGWEPRISLSDGLAATAQWYRDNRSWWSTLLDEAESLYDDALRLDPRP